MAIQFPSSPTLNQTYTHNSITWTYNGTAWTKSSGGGGGGGASLPTQANNSGKFLTTDGTSANWGTITAPTPTAVSDQSNSSTGYFDIPSGTTAQRPVTPVTGALRLNTETNYTEMYYNSVWNNLNYLGGIVATGGTITTSGNYKIHTFTGSGVFELISSPQGSTIDLLVVAGGGTGGLLTGQGVRAGGGGAGGLVYIENYPVNNANYTITVGAGGSSASGTAVAVGNNSVFSGNSGIITALGGGTGGYNDNTDNATAGGSGGGGWYPGYVGKPSTQPVNTNDGKAVYNSTGWGNKGGDSSGAQPYAAGGGGAGGPGGNANTGNGPVGGTGKQLSISGTLTYYAGGGGGAGYPPQAGYAEYAGGLGGGGTGSNDSYDVISNAAPYTGGGGGSGGSGGSGIVIIKYRYQ